METTANIEAVAVGDFIDIPLWRTFGCVMGVERMHDEQMVKALVQESPNQKPEDWRHYTLRSEDFSIES